MIRMTRHLRRYYLLTSDAFHDMICQLILIDVIRWSEAGGSLHLDDLLSSRGIGRDPVRLYMSP
jgi:hypothetical protein